MTKQGRKILVALLLILVLFSASSQYAKMAMELSFWDAMGSLVLITAIIGGAVYWIKRSKKSQ